MEPRWSIIGFIACLLIPLIAGQPPVPTPSGPISIILPDEPAIGTSVFNISRSSNGINGLPYRQQALPPVEQENYLYPDNKPKGNILNDENCKPAIEAIIMILQGLIDYRKVIVPPEQLARLDGLISIYIEIIVRYVAPTFQDNLTQPISYRLQLLIAFLKQTKPPDNPNNPSDDLINLIKIILERIKNTDVPLANLLGKIIIIIQSNPFNQNDKEYNIFIDLLYKLKDIIENKVTNEKKEDILYKIVVTIQTYVTTHSTADNRPLFIDLNKLLEQIYKASQPTILKITQLIELVQKYNFGPLPPCQSQCPPVNTYIIQYLQAIISSIQSGITNTAQIDKITQQFIQYLIQSQPNKLDYQIILKILQTYLQNVNVNNNPAYTQINIYINNLYQRITLIFNKMIQVNPVPENPVYPVNPDSNSFAEILLQLQQYINNLNQDKPQYQNKIFVLLIKTIQQLQKENNKPAITNILEILEKYNWPKDDYYVQIQMIIKLLKYLQGINEYHPEPVENPDVIKIKEILKIIIKNIQDNGNNIDSSLLMNLVKVTVMLLENMNDIKQYPNFQHFIEFLLVVNKHVMNNVPQSDMTVYIQDIINSLYSNVNGQGNDSALTIHHLVLLLTQILQSNKGNVHNINLQELFQKINALILQITKDKTSPVDYYKQVIEVTLVRIKSLFQINQATVDNMVYLITTNLNPYVISKNSTCHEIVRDNMVRSIQTMHSQYVNSQYCRERSNTVSPTNQPLRNFSQGSILPASAIHTGVHQTFNDVSNMRSFNSQRPVSPVGANVGQCSEALVQGFIKTVRVIINNYAHELLHCSDYGGPLDSLDSKPTHSFTDHINTIHVIPLFIQYQEQGRPNQQGPPIQGPSDVDLSIPIQPATNDDNHYTRNQPADDDDANSTLPPYYLPATKPTIDESLLPKRPPTNYPNNVIPIIQLKEPPPPGSNEAIKPFIGPYFIPNDNPQRPPSRSNEGPNPPAPNSSPDSQIHINETEPIEF